MGCSSSAPHVDLVDGASTTSTFGAITKTAGASAGIRFGVHRIAKTIEKNGKDQDRYAFLLRERKNPEGGDASTASSKWNPETGGSFALGIFDGHGESPKAADLAAGRLLSSVFEKHFRSEEAKSVSNEPESPLPKPGSMKRSASMEELRQFSGFSSPSSLVRNPAAEADMRSPSSNTRCEQSEDSKLVEFQELDLIIDAFREALVPFLTAGEAQKGETIMTQGEAGNYVLFLSEGCLDITVNETLVGTESAGAIIGEIALLKTCQRTATVKCQTETASYWLLSRTDWESVLGLDPRFDAVRQTLSDLADDRLGCTAFLHRLRPLAPLTPVANPQEQGESTPRKGTKLTVNTQVEKSIYAVASAPVQSDFPSPTDAVISRAFVDVDSDIRSRWSNERTGTTATVLILSPISSSAGDLTSPDDCGEAKWNATIAWAGDSRAVMMLPSKDTGKLSSKFVQITRDHHVKSEEERTRIMNASSSEVRLSPAGKRSTTIAKRVSESGQKGPEAVLNEENGVSLMVTRSLGDPYGSAAVIPHPQIIRPRSPNLGIGVPRGTRFILASDGLWDVMSSENAANHIRKVSDPLKAAGKLAAIAQNRWMNTLRRIDDIAVSVIDLV